MRGRKISDGNLLDLGSDVVRQLLPHRPPLLMVNRILGFEPGEHPVLWARRHISANEPVFEGHFPELKLWPGIYTQEGLGQTSLLLEVLCFMTRTWSERGHDASEVLDALKNLERGYRLRPGFQPHASRPLEELKSARPRVGLSGSVQMRFVEPVFAGECLEYQARRTQVIEERLARFEVEARVEGRLVAEGVLVGAVGVMPLPGGPEP